MLGEETAQEDQVVFAAAARACKDQKKNQRKSGLDWAVVLGSSEPLIVSSMHIFISFKHFHFLVFFLSLFINYFQDWIQGFWGFAPEHLQPSLKIKGLTNLGDGPPSAVDTLE